MATIERRPCSRLAVTTPGVVTLGMRDAPRLVTPPLSRWSARPHGVIGMTAIVVCVLLAPTSRAQREFVSEVPTRPALKDVDVDAPDPARPPKPSAAPAKPLAPTGPSGTVANGVSLPAKQPQSAAGKAAKGKGISTPPPEAPPAVSPQGFVIAPTGRAALLEKWEVRARQVRKHDVVEARKLVPMLDDALLDVGVQGTHGGYASAAAARALVDESLQSSSDGDEDQALALLETARRSAPDLPLVSGALALVAWRAGDVGSMVDAVAKTVAATLRDGAGFAGLAQRVVAGACLLVALLLLLFAVLLSAPLVRYLAFDVVMRLPKGARQFQVVALLVLLMLLPPLVGAGPIFSSLWVIALTWGYLNRPAQIVAALLGAAAFALPIGLSALARLAAYEGSSTQRALAALSSLDAADELAELRASSAELDALQHAALGFAAKREGDLASARTHLDASVRIAGADDVDFAFVQGELGVLAALNNQDDNALAGLGKAVATDARLTTALFNIVSIHLRAGRADKADAATKQMAQGSDDLNTLRRVTYRVPDQTVNHNRAFVDVVPPPGSFLYRGMAPSARSRAIEEELSSTALAGQVGERAAALCSVFFALCALWVFLKPRVYPSVPCDLCGAPSASAGPSRAGGPTKSAMPGVCAQCFHVFVSTRSRIDAGVKLKKERAIASRNKRHQRMLWLLSLVCPGAGHLYVGAAARGTALAAGFFSALWVIALALGLWPASRPVGTVIETAAMLLAGVGALVVWMLGLRSAAGLARDLQRRK